MVAIGILYAIGVVKTFAYYMNEITIATGAVLFLLLTLDIGPSN
jgi:hypothetical protein